MKANEFKKYWDKKSQKRRKSWAAKAKRFAEQHTQLEDIRKEVYLPLDYGANFSFEDYKPEHFVKLNPITSWQDKNFCFSEEGLRAALKAEGADMNSFETAWTPCYEVTDLLKTTYPSLRIFYKAEEPGSGVYLKNDAEGKYFPETEFDGHAFELMTEEREQMQTRLIRGIKDGSIEVKVSKDNDKG